MAENIVFVTGHMAQARLERVLGEMAPTPFEWRIVDAGVKVAALMTMPLLERRLKLPKGTSRVVLPGRCRVDLDRLSSVFGVPFERGPDEVADLPHHFGKEGKAPDLSRYDVRIFAEIVEAPSLSLDALLTRAERLAAAGADVIDLGCLPDTPFPLLDEAVHHLKRDGFRVSVDSADPAELERGIRAGADFVLSLNTDTLHLAQLGDTVPVLVPKVPGDMDSLLAAMDTLSGWGKPFIADPVLDPIHFGFLASLLRYAELRRLRPDAEILMGTGNLTELTEADSGGLTAVLMGIISELGIRNVLTVQVSPHTRRTVQEHDAARRLMYAARADGALPKGYSQALLSLHDKKPFPSSPGDITAMAAQVRDSNYRIEASEDGIHLYNRDGHHVAQNAFDLYSRIEVGQDAGHAFYLGAELMKAETACRLGKRYTQDQPLDWGVAADMAAEDLTKLQEAGHTLRSKLIAEAKQNDAADN
jgi:dihydropteroate synthase-like protein